MRKNRRPFAGPFAGPFASLMIPALGMPLAGWAQQAPSGVSDRVEITGSAIRRIEGETALPVQVLRREDIARTGATSTVDLLARLPAVQGSTQEASNVGGNSFGFAGVSVHNLGETRTLVLLNGRRLAQFGGQSLTGSAAAVDLNTIPISAIERIEILTDGASALYGSDAVAGVVNFITKRSGTDGDVTIGFSRPRDGAHEKRISASKGFGQLDADGFNLNLALAHETRTKLDSTARSFAKTGIIDFGFNGKRYRAFLGSTRGIPANVVDDDGNLVSPYFMTTGACAPQNVAVTDTASGTTSCQYDFVTELEIYPTRERSSASAALTVKLGAEHEFFADALAARSNSVSRIAPVPGVISIPAGSSLHDTYLLPLGITQDTTASYRVKDLGKRTGDDTARFYNVDFGVRGLLAGWDYDAAYGHSESDVKGSISGYPGARAFNALLESGLINPFVLAGQQSAAAQAALSAIAFKGYWDGGLSKLDTLDLRASRELAKLSAGSLLLGTGLSMQTEKFQSKPSAFAQGLLADPVAGIPADATHPADVRFGDEATSIPYSADRRAYGAFAEIVAPLAKGLEASAAVRYDKYSDVGNATTGKFTLRYSPTPSVLLRASIGSGFKAPTVPQLNASLQQFGVTSAPYDCTPALLQIAQSLNAQCRPNGTQYDQFAGGNTQLEPEKSRQGTIGIRFEPSPSLSFGADLWHVGIRDAFGQITEQEVFANPARYPGAWTRVTEVSTGITYVAFNASNQNLGKQFSTGIDFDVTGRWTTPIGRLSSQLAATYMIREQAQTQIGGPYYSALGNNAELGAVTFRWQGKVTTVLQAGDWTHTLGFNFKTGYRDALETVEVLDANGAGTGETEDVRIQVPRYYTFDWQTAWRLQKRFTLTVGLLNLFDKAPPLSLAEGGINKGQMFGYDDRYYDPRGRTLYANLSYSF